jgi:hypothetical protein
MSAAHLLTDPKAIAAFITAGNSTFTVKSVKTGTRFTYRVRAVDDPRPHGPTHFVSMMRGPDNETDYSYLGQLYDGQPSYQHGRKSKIDQHAPCAKAIDWLCHKLLLGVALPSVVEFWHEGRCGRCNRKLTDPTSIARGIGPECAGIMGAAS